jgi:hypothetical protein
MLVFYVKEEKSNAIKTIHARIVPNPKWNASFVTRSRLAGGKRNSPMQR